MLINSIKDSLHNVPIIISKFEEDLEGFEENLRLKDRHLEKSIIDQVSWISYYDQKRVELKAIVKYLRLRLEKIQGKLWKDYTENYSRDLMAKDKDRYISNEAAFVEISELCIIFEELYDKYDSVVNTFTARGYALNNIVKIRTSALELLVL